MPKVKTKKAAAKRFKVSKNGKVKYQKAFKRHILSKKSAKRKMRLRKAGLVDKASVGLVKAVLPYAF